MFCEPVFDLPQKVDINTIRQSWQPKPKVDDKPTTEQKRNDIIHKWEENYNVLPMVTDRNEQIRPVLSLKENPYLKCKWEEFLENKPKKYVKIQLYADYKESLKVKPNVRKRLNGKFYGINNKLSPIPVLPDPRNLESNYYRKCKGKSIKN